MLLIELITDVVEVFSLVLRRYVGNSPIRPRCRRSKSELLFFRDQAPITEKMKCYFITQNYYLKCAVYVGKFAASIVFVTKIVDV